MSDSITKELTAPVRIIPLLTDNKTSFSFAVPPFPDRIDLAAKAANTGKCTL